MNGVAGLAGVAGVAGRYLLGRPRPPAGGPVPRPAPESAPMVAPVGACPVAGAVPRPRLSRAGRAMIGRKVGL